jgi:subtilisin family serine protease
MKLLNLLLSSFLLIACAKESENDNKTTLVPSKATQSKAEVASDLKTQIKKLNHFPIFTVIMVPKVDVQTSIEALTKGGGKLVYDPNNGYSSTIPFYIAELTPKQINDEKFIKSLSLKAATIDAKETQQEIIETRLNSGDLEFTNFIPVESVGLTELGEQTDMGKNVTVAVIDTGIDASHPAFGNRVVYWFDGTEETKTELTLVQPTNNSVEIEINKKKTKVVLPKNLPSGDLYVGVMDEKNYTAQLRGPSKKEGYMDINYNKKSDVFIVAAVKTESGFEVLYDENADHKFSTKSELEYKMDYNETKKSNRDKGMISFPSRNNIVSYPLLMSEEDGKVFIQLGKASGMHGTHVAGIIAADDKKANLLGAAPKADLMSLKVCSGISCTNSAIIKALYKAFYNGKVIPDVVNISLGSHEGTSPSVYSHLFQDLSAKFGTVFFISASNSGPGFRSLNHIGNSGAVVMVGAGVSEETLRDQYNLPETAEVDYESLLFFSSLGPSYTGEMKPNIVAPGAAISATLAAENYMSQANGTSMSSPLAAGAMAAILGEIKRDDSSLFSEIKKMRKLNLLGQKSASKTLLPYAYAMRASLMETAVYLENLTAAQQGAGLIQASDAYDHLTEEMEKLKAEETDYFEVVINNAKSGYDRSGKIKDLNSFTLTLGLDGERTKKSLSKIMANGVDIRLEKVEVLNTDGTVELLDYDKTDYFYIVSRGDSQERLEETHVTFNNRRTPNFHSKRVLKNMKKGKTYIAHYSVKYGEHKANVTNILDIVHMPFHLKNRKVDVPGINPSLSVVQRGFAIKDVEIGANVFQRYPIYVDSSTHNLDLKVSTSPGAQGRLFVQLYSPEGKEVKFEVAQNTSIHAYKMAEMNVSTKKKGKIQEGVWEVTISTSSSDWLGVAKYDLLIQGEKFGPEKTQIEGKLGEELIIPFQTDGNDITHLIMTNLVQVHKQMVAVKSAHVSYHPLDLPEGFTGKITQKIVDKTDRYWGSIMDGLFVLKDGEFIQYDGEFTAKAGAISLKEASKEKLYFGLNTIRNFGETAQDLLKKVEVISEYKLPLNVDLKTSHENISSMGMELIKVKMDTDENITTIADGAEKYIGGTLQVISGKVTRTSDHSGITLMSIADDAKLSTLQIIFKK